MRARYLIRPMKHSYGMKLERNSNKIEIELKSKSKLQLN